MAEKTVYLVTGANRGIGRALVELLIQRANTVVIATTRKASASALESISTEVPVDPSSKLLGVVLDEASSSDTSASLPAAIAALAAQHPDLGLDHIDVVVANAGTSAGFHSIDSTDPENLVSDFIVNAVGPAKLFRAAWPLMEKAAPEKRKLVLISSSLGSIGGGDLEHFPCTSYGMSKAAANWWGRKVSHEFKDRSLKVGIIQPGWVQTDMGQAVANAINHSGPPMTSKDSAKNVLERIDTLTMEKSGQFLNYDGTDMVW